MFRAAAGEPVLSLGCWPPVRVGPQRRRGRGVPQLTLHRVDVTARRDQAGRVAMAQAMQPPGSPANTHRFAEVPLV